MMRKLIYCSLCIVLLVNLAACGTILYPERRGQTQGQLDAGVVMLDALGLLLFFVPGVVAFAIDFANGTIYLPQGQALQMTDEQQKQLVVDGKLDRLALHRIIDELQPGASISDAASQWQIEQIYSPAQLNTLLDRPATAVIAAVQNLNGW